MAVKKSLKGRARAAELRAGQKSSEQVSAVFLAGRGAERAERGKLRALVAAEAAGGGSIDVEAGTVFTALRSIQDFQRLRAGDRLSLLVIHGEARVLASGELVFPLSPTSQLTATRLRAVLRAAEIGRQVVVIDCEPSFERRPTGDIEAAYRMVLEKAFRVAADDRLVIARRPGDHAGLTPRLAETLERTGLAAGGEESWLRAGPLTAVAAAVRGRSAMVVGDPGEITPVLRTAAADIADEAEAAREESFDETLDDDFADEPDAAEEADAEGAVAEDALESREPDEPIGSRLAKRMRMRTAKASGSESVAAKDVVGPGKLHHDVPKRMRVGLRYDVQVSISRDLTDAAKRGLAADTESHDVRVAAVMAVSLRDPEDAFEITQLSESQQPIDLGAARAQGFVTEEGPDRGLWRWRVAPKRWGEYPLTLHATAFIRDAEGRLIPAPEQNDRIHVAVRVNFGREILRVLKWAAIALGGYLLIDAAGGPLAAGLIADLPGALSELLKGR